MIVLIGELILSAVVYHMHGEIEEYALNQLNTSISTYNKTGQEASTQAWNLLQSDVNTFCFNIGNFNDVGSWFNDIFCFFRFLDEMLRNQWTTRLEASYTR